LAFAGHDPPELEGSFVSPVISGAADGDSARQFPRKILSGTCRAARIGSRVRQMIFWADW